MKFLRGKQAKYEVRTEEEWNTNNTVCILRGRSGVVEEFSLLGCSAVSPGNLIPKFRRIAVTASSRSRSLRCLETSGSDYPVIAVISQKNGIFKRI